MPRNVAITLLGSGVGLVLVGVILYARGSEIAIPIALVGLVDIAIATVFLRRGPRR
jgi:hypothetical protein